MKRRNNATHRRDNSRWIVVGLTALALTGVGAMHTHVLMLRRGLDLLPAAAQAAGIILLAAIPIGYLVYRIWFSAPRPMLKVGASAVFAPNLVSGDDAPWPGAEPDLYYGPSGYGLYAGGTRID